MANSSPTAVTVGNVPTNGTLQIDQNGTLTLENSTINGGIVSNSGTIDVTADSSINDTVSFVNAGTVNADGAELDLVGTTINNSGGTFKTTGKGILGLENATINGGTLADGDCNGRRQYQQHAERSYSCGRHAGDGSRRCAGIDR